VLTTAAIKTLAELVDALRGSPPTHRLALIDARGVERLVSWSALRHNAVRHAVWLEQQGFAPGDRLIICLTQEFELLSCFLGCLWSGVIPLSVGPAQPGEAELHAAERIARWHRLAQARGVVAQSELLGSQHDARTVGGCGVVTLPPAEFQPAPELVNRAPTRVADDALAFVQFSSGSTARPKGVCITHRNALDNIRLIVAMAGRHSEEAATSWLPLHHDMGLVSTLLATLYVCPRRMSLIHPMRFMLRPISWLKEITDHRSRVSVTPNFGLDLCAERIREAELEREAIDLSSLELVFVGAEPVRPATLARFASRFRRRGLRDDVLTPVYGMAEATLVVTAPQRHEAGRTRSVADREIPTVGRPLGDQQIRIVDPHGQTLGAGQIGEIWLRGTSIAAGYLDPIATRQAFSNGWLRSGDLGLLDEEGLLYITGRAKDQIILDGRNIDAQDVAAALEELPFIERGQVAVLALERERGEALGILVTPLTRVTQSAQRKLSALQHPDSRTALEAGFPPGWAGDPISWLDRLIRSSGTELATLIRRLVLIRFGVAPDDVVFVARIPRTTSGKLRREECRVLYHAVARSNQHQSDRDHDRNRREHHAQHTVARRQDHTSADPPAGGEGARQHHRLPPHNCLVQHEHREGSQLDEEHQ
jgi:acyl-CoA synthetase (AMP-forming)/AMP-acid ligase II